VVEDGAKMPVVGFGELMLAVIVPAMALGCWSDLRRHRVPNWLNASIAVTGLIAQAAYRGWSGLGTGVLGLFVGLGLLIVLWAMKGMGAGDVKFMAALGTWLGPQLAFYAVIAGGLAGGVIAVGLILYRRCWREASANLGVVWVKMCTVETAFSEFGSAKSLSRSTGVLPYAVPLSIGTLTVVVCNSLGWWRVF
jgi:prepilin peptidase CpaA